MAEFNVVVEPGKSRDTDPLLVLFPTDIFEGLESYGAAVEKFNGIHPQQYSSTTWCSWYAGYGRAAQANLGALEKAMTVNARLMKPLLPLGADMLRVVDDSNDQRYGDWNFPFVPHGMGVLAGALHAEGMKAGYGWRRPGRQRIPTSSSSIRIGSSATLPANWSPAGSFTETSCISWMPRIRRCGRIFTTSSPGSAIGATST